MFRRILVPVDFDRRNLRAVRAAAGLGGQGRAEVTLLHVIERIADDESGALEAFYRKLETAARAKMRKLLAPFEGKRVPVRAEIVYGKPAAEILRFAERNGSDLIVMSSHRLPLRGSAESWGTLSYKIGILSRCPVLLVK